MKKKNKVSIIVNCRNGSEYLEKAIKSVLSQSYTNWELIFFDNKSTDTSLNIIKQFKDKRIKIYLNKKKNYLNLYEARNFAIKKSKGDYITFLDTDDLWKKNKLKDQVKLANNLPYKIFYSNYHVLDQKKKKYFLKYKNNLPSGLITQNLLDNYFISILTLFIKKDIFKKFRFDKKYNIIGDFDLILKLSKKYNIIALQKSLVIYRIHSNNYSEKKLNLYIKELEFWIRKNQDKKYRFYLLKYYLLKLKIKFFLKNFYKVFD